MHESDLKIIFGSSENYHLTLTPEAMQTNTPPAKSIMMRVEGQAGQFKGNTTVPMTLGMLEHTLIALEEFSGNPVGEFTLASESREFWASMTGDGSDQIIAHCTLNDCNRRFTRLRFEVSISLKELPQIRNKIEEILESFSY
jgi:hypothetical protein